VSASEVKLQSTAREGAASGSFVLFGLVGAGLLLRLLFIGHAGFKNDVEAFQSWAMTLAQVPLWQFYAKAGFADYPPGYFYILSVVGHLHAAFADPDFTLLRVMIKLPAIIADLLVGMLIFRIALRFTTRTWSYIAAAAYILNPVTIYISAAWGQIDAISGGLALLGIYLLMRADETQDTVSDRFILGAWLALAYSLLIKPQAAILIPLFIAFAFADRMRVRQRVAATAAGILASFALAWILSLPFHPAANPLTVLGWLLGQYAKGAAVYPYTSINAFNLWSIRWDFWLPDTVRELFIPRYALGMLLLGAAAVVTILRYLQLRTSLAMLEAAALLALAFFLLSTRMHERYIFDGLLFTIALVFAGKRYRTAAVVLSITLFANLMYSLSYINAINGHLPVNAANLMPLISRPLSLVNVAVLFVLGWSYLGDEVPAQHPAFSEKTGAGLEIASDPRSRTWFDPREGLAALKWPVDHAIAAGLGLLSFVLSFIGYANVKTKIFDEIYFARAAEEYLKHQYIYENTHPPLTKLLITLSTIMFGGLAHGDNAAGWRFLDLVAGALMVSLLYAFAVRITGSRFFAALAAGLLVLDGMHFVQSRIATPESFVGLFALATLYTFYRYWLASQVRRADDVVVPRAVLVRVVGTTLCFLLALGLNYLLFHTQAFTRYAFFHDGSSLAQMVAVLYLFAGLYLLFRGVVLRLFAGSASSFVSYPDGTKIRLADGAVAVETADGGRIDSRRKMPVPGDLTLVQKGMLTLRDDELLATYKSDGSLEYKTPTAGARFALDGTMIDGSKTDFGPARLWLLLFAASITALVTSKWYGVMIYPATLAIIAWVWAQPRIAQALKELSRRPRHPARWGNPFGFPLDVVAATLVFVGATIYFGAYTPHFVGLADTPGAAPRSWSFTDVVNEQPRMYAYHANLKATHPYASSWWQWPLDLRPIAYYWQDSRGGNHTAAENACCVAEITSLPNPLILWFGLFSVPFIGWLAYREKNKGYLLLIVSYLLLWLPWMRSPRISFAYHFYADIPIICLCNAIALQRLWTWGNSNPKMRIWSRIGTFGFVGAAALMFAFLYPLLAGVPMTWGQWNIRTLPFLMGSRWV